MSREAMPVKTSNSAAAAYADMNFKAIAISRERI